MQTGSAEFNVGFGDIAKRKLLTWQAAYAIARGVTFLIPIMEATHVLTLAWSDRLRARRLFSIISAPLPSPSTSLAEEGEVKIALNPCQALSHGSIEMTGPFTIINNFDLIKPCSRLAASAL